MLRRWVTKQQVLCLSVALRDRDISLAQFNPDDARTLLLRTFVVQLAAVTKICPQPRQNAAATKRATKMASMTQTVMVF